MITTDARGAQLVLERHRNDFDLVAPVYDLLAAAVFAGAIRRAQLALLPQLSDVKSVLIIGGGSGWFLLELLRRIPDARVLYLEKSPKMLSYSVKLIREQAPEALPRVEFLLGTQESLEPGQRPFDLIVTNFFLDLFREENSAVIAGQLREHLAPRGRWLFVDFHLPERGLARVYATALFKVMFTFFNVVSRMESHQPPNYERIFSGLRLRTYEERSFYASIIRAKLLRDFTSEQQS